jgi:hypothetical protein
MLARSGIRFAHRQFVSHFVSGGFDMKNSSTLNRSTGIVLILQGLLIFVPMIVLGAAINWPDSLGDPASIALPRLLEQAEGVRLGYGAYFAYSVLFLVSSALLAHVLSTHRGDSGLLKIALGAGALSALARTIGIIRWLVAMPALATLYVDPAASAGTREAVAVSFEALNAFGGSIGELLGVTTFASIWLVIVSFIIVRDGMLPRWLGVFGLIAAASMLLNLLELFGVDLGGLITLTLALEHLWLITVGVVLLLRRAAPAAR